MEDFPKILKYSLFIAIFIFIVERTLGNGFNVGIEQLLIVFSVHFIYAFVLNIINTWFFHYLDQFISWKEQPKKRLIYGSIGAVFVTMIGIIFLRYFVVITFEHGGFQEFLNTSKSYYIFSFIITLIILITIHAIYFFKELSKQKITEQKVISKIETAKFESLKNQLDPHFLFNSLNVLTSLIGENPKQAEKFTTKLSKVYRYVLQQKSQDLIAVNKELSFAKTYMDLLKIRFEDSIDFNITDDLDQTLKIIPLSLQLLLENAVKHNELSNQNKLKLSIYKEQNYLVIENNIHLKNNLVKSTKVGLNNIKERYALVSKTPVIIEQTTKKFKVKLPLLTKKQHIMNTTNQQENYLKATQKVKKLKEFYRSLISFIIILPMLFYIWKTYTPNVIQWFWFPFVGWGSSLIAQALDIYGFTTKWEQRKVKEYMNNEDEKIQF